MAQELIGTQHRGLNFRETQKAPKTLELWLSQYKFFSIWLLIPIYESKFSQNYSVWKFRKVNRIKYSEIDSIILYLIRRRWIQSSCLKEKFIVQKNAWRLSVWFVLVFLFVFGCLFIAVIWLLVQIEKINVRKRLVVFFIVYSPRQFELVLWLSFQLGKNIYNWKENGFHWIGPGITQESSLTFTFPCPIHTSRWMNHTSRVFSSLCKLLALFFNIIGIFICLHVHVPQLLKVKHYFFSMFLEGLAQYIVHWRFLLMMPCFIHWEYKVHDIQR